jgi:hypothetical protein
MQMKLELTRKSHSIQEKITIDSETGVMWEFKEEKQLQ